MRDKTVEFGNGSSGSVSLASPILRFEGNPILSARDVNLVWRDPSLQVVTTHNAGVTIHEDETIMLFRSHLRSGRSVIGLARSSNGLTDWRIAPSPFIVPATADDQFAPQVNAQDQIAMEAGGVEDPRINVVEGQYVITYTAYDAKAKDKARVCLITTSDFKSVVRHGPLRNESMRNVVIFPEKIGGQYLGLFRPNDELPGDLGGKFRQILLGSTQQLGSGQWELEPTPVMRSPEGPSAFSDKIGPGAPPVKTAAGWLNLFHGVRHTMSGNPYVLGIALHDLVDPRKVQVSAVPILFPTAADCRVSETDYVHAPGVVFSCAMLRRNDGTLVIYYAGNDTVMNVALSHEDVLVALCQEGSSDL